jgi:hypothetical protein
VDIGFEKPFACPAFDAARALANEIGFGRAASAKRVALRQYGGRKLACYAACMANVSVVRSDEVAEDAAASQWLIAHHTLSRLARERAAADADEGAVDARSSALGGARASFNEYIERLFGYEPRTTREKLCVAEALETLPALADALSRGALGRCASR